MHGFLTKRARNHMGLPLGSAPAKAHPHPTGNSTSGTHAPDSVGARD